MTRESVRVQNFVDVHRNLVLNDALRDLENCELTNLSKLLHRLKGTLGTFQFRELAEKLQNLLAVSANERSPSHLSRLRDAAINEVKVELKIEEKIN